MYNINTLNESFKACSHNNCNCIAIGCNLFLHQPCPIVFGGKYCAILGIQVVKHDLLTEFNDFVTDIQNVQ